MIGLLGNETNTLLQGVARFTERRQAILASNVAHATTPGYERRDLDVRGFQKALQQAVERRRTPSRHDSTALRPVDAFEQNAFSEELFAPLADVDRNVRFHDGGVRSVETEMTELTKNSMLHAFAIEVMNAQFAMLQTVIGERP